MGRPIDAIRSLPVVAAVCFALFQSCGSSGRSSKDGGEPEGTDEVRQYEKEFRPSEFDPDPTEALGESPRARHDTVDNSRRPRLPASAELVPGFRVQIFSSTDIDEATTIKTAAELQFPTDWFYLVYEPPAYKVRAGDFITRYDADRFAKTLRDGGHDDSWIVPDRVCKNPAPRPLLPGNGDNQQK